MIIKLAWKNIWFKPLNTILSLVLLATSVAIISVLLLIQEQFEQKFSSNIDGIDMVIGAQGSPLQLLLSSVYQIDAPTGNIAYDSAKVWMKHPFVKSAIPLAFGDNYRGFKIVGTTPDYIKKFDAKFAKGKINEKNFQVVLGSEVASKLGLKLGSKFFGTHGDAEEGHVHDEYAYIVTGILKPTEKVIDNVIICNIPSVWAMHHTPADEESDAVEEHVHDENCNHDHEEEHVHNENCNHDHEEEHVHDENCNHNHQVEISEEGQEITAVLVKFKNKMGIVSWPRILAQNTKMQGVLPALEINRLFTLFGVGITALQYLAFGIMFVSGLSIFIALYNRLKERKYEFALLRISGATRLQLLLLVVLESFLLCVVGFIFGIIFGRIAMLLVSLASQEEFKLAFNPYTFLWQKEGILFLITLLVGVIAASIPAIKAYTMNISKTLANA